jgi:SAM-dependent methyltransferase
MQVEDYTARAALELEERYLRIDENGIYKPHQPIYGFRQLPSEPDHVPRYAITFAMLDVLSRISFSTLLDVGGAEGYKAFLAQSLLGSSVVTTDLSAEACNRAREIFNLDARPADIHSLPFANGSFDVVTCSETLEHVPDLRAAVGELLRVARTAVVITVPHESEASVKAHNKGACPHIHSLTAKSFNFVSDYGWRIISIQRLIYPLGIRQMMATMDARTRPEGEGNRAKRLAIAIHNALIPVTRFCTGPRTAKAIISLDRWACRLSGQFSAMVLVAAKEYCIGPPRRKNDLDEILRFAVARHPLLHGVRLKSPAVRATRG